MERLTTRYDGHAVMEWEYEEKYTTSEWIDMLTDRLAAYEDIGLEPEEIKERLEAGKELFFELADLYNDLGPVDHLRELVQAEKDGQLVVLPCKVGSTVFAAETRPVIPLYVAHVGVVLDGGDGEDWESLDNFGKTIFLTHEEAEAALKKMEADNEAD